VSGSALTLAVPTDDKIFGSVSALAKVLVKNKAAKASIIIKFLFMFSPPPSSSFYKIIHYLSITSIFFALNTKSMLNLKIRNLKIRN
jgi:hypothetical protein